MTLIGRASVNGRTGVLYARKFDQNAQNSKLDGPAYEYAQNKMAGVHVRTRTPKNN